MSLKHTICLKNNSTSPTIFNETHVITDRARAFFPFPSFWQGSWIGQDPIVINRRAGFRPREYYTPKSTTFTSSHAYPQHCFANRSTRYPCYPECIDDVYLKGDKYLRNSKIYTFR